MNYNSQLQYQINPHPHQQLPPNPSLSQQVQHQPQPPHQPQQHQQHPDGLNLNVNVNINNQPTRRGPWSPDEDRRLLDLIALYGPTNWVRISNSLGSRTPKQCRERYHQNLKPSLNRSPITPEEGAYIEKLVAKYGKRWAEIARHLNGRSDNAIKNWWNGGANRRRRASVQAIQPLNSKKSSGSLNNSISSADDLNDGNSTDHVPINNNNTNLIDSDQNKQPSQYPQIHQFPQVSFNTSIFGNGSNLNNYNNHNSNAVNSTNGNSGNNNASTGHPANSSTTMPSSNSAINSHNNNLSIIRPPLTNRSSSFDHSNSSTGSHLLPHHHVNPHHFSHITHLPPLMNQTSAILPSKRRMLDEGSQPLRRHSAANVLYQIQHQNGSSGNHSHPNLLSAVNNSNNSNSTTPNNNAGNLSPYPGSPSSFANSSRTNSISCEYSLLSNNPSDPTSTSTSRRSSIAPDFFPNPLSQSIHQNSSNPSHKTIGAFQSPSLLPQRFSISSASGPMSTTNSTITGGFQSSNNSTSTVNIQLPPLSPHSASLITPTNDKFSSAPNASHLPAHQLQSPHHLQYQHPPHHQGNIFRKDFTFNAPQLQQSQVQTHHLNLSPEQPFHRSSVSSQHSNVSSNMSSNISNVSIPPPHLPPQQPQQSTNTTSASDTLMSDADTTTAKTTANSVTINASSKVDDEEKEDESKGGKISVANLID